MAARATWKGFLRLGELVCAVGLYTAVSASDRVSLHMVNRKTGNRLSRRFVDSQTGKVVEREAQVKGYEVDSGDFVVLEPDEIAEVTPKGDKALTIESFLPCAEVDDLYFDRPYYLRPADAASQASFAVIREGLRSKQVAAVARAVLFRRPRSLLIRAYDEGIIATTLNYDYEVRSAAEAFEDIREVKMEPEMLDLARHIIETKSDRFQPESFDDRYDAALAELVRAKMEGRATAPPKPPPAKVVSLMDALRESAGMSGDKKSAGRKPGSTKAGSNRAGRKPAARKLAARTRKAG
ncbi:Ku protein [Ancylobacter dichloromethanicus]|uniref:Non-homologous end joining protein Ku n=1 Tax=Ancylobacter dichloromethanicus TaxID=518825 RepID=A0A9W6N1E8_9HYPH|nr:Ku protein [Ancylobacter dichloromethanicus]MBS7552227.1 Ku protein [Ancylobacter dichloromethanicus]GLK73962.1 non-homologous end joining protein Ku [Ancylobacter dichloromethanicus]